MISLEPINDSNVWKICNLKVSKDQEGFIATNSQSIVEAYVATTTNTVAIPLAIKNDEEYVGFVMLGYGHNGLETDPEIAYDNYCIWRFMIDASHQRKGYGKLALIEVLKYLQTFPKGEAKYVWLSYEPENVNARQFYESLGFKENGEMCSNEIVSVMAL